MRLCASKLQERRGERGARGDLFSASEEEEELDADGYPRDAVVVVIIVLISCCSGGKQIHLRKKIVDQTDTKKYGRVFQLHEPSSGQRGAQATYFS